MRIEDLPSAIGLLAVAAIIAGAMGVVLGEFVESEVTYPNYTDTVTCTALDTWLELNSSDTTYFITLVNSSFMNATNSTLGFTHERFGNWSINETGGDVRCLSGGNLSVGYSYNFSYRIELGSGGRNIFSSGIEGVSDLADWLDIVALVLASVIILGMVFVVLRIVQTGGGGSL